MDERQQKRGKRWPSRWQTRVDDGFSGGREVICRQEAMVVADKWQ